MVNTANIDWPTKWDFSFKFNKILKFLDRDMAVQLGINNSAENIFYHLKDAGWSSVLVEHVDVLVSKKRNWVILVAWSSHRTCCRSSYRTRWRSCSTFDFRSDRLCCTNLSVKAYSSNIILKWVSLHLKFIAQPIGLHITELWLNRGNISLPSGFTWLLNGMPIQKANKDEIKLTLILAIQCCLMIKSLFWLSLRMVTGFLFKVSLIFVD